YPRAALYEQYNEQRYDIPSTKRVMSEIGVWSIYAPHGARIAKYGFRASQEVSESRCFAHAKTPIYPKDDEAQGRITENLMPMQPASLSGDPGESHQQHEQPVRHAHWHVPNAHYCLLPGRSVSLKTKRQSIF